ncbi:hypothetical protein [Nocardioides sp.]|uniref:hypothetical protein n=1 Tax=Nocardioides sp. TaxID=35761 RepID=UPI00378467C3
MSLGFRLVLLTSALLVGLGSLTASAEGAAVTTPTRLQLDPTPAYADRPTTLEVDLTSDAGDPVPGAPVLVERRTAGAWTSVATLTTDAEGHAAVDLVVARTAADNAVRATYAGDVDHDPVTTTGRLELLRRNGRVATGGPEKVVDGHDVAVTVRWTTRSGDPVEGTVELFRSLAGKRWELVRRLRTDTHGRAAITTTPRVDSRWRARAVGQEWVEGGWSPVHRVDNLPPTPPVRLPAAAPRPRRSLPPQPRAAGDGPHWWSRRSPPGPGGRWPVSPGTPAARWGGRRSGWSG